MKAAPILLSALLLAALTPAWAQAQTDESQKYFEIQTPDPPKPKTQSVGISFLDQGSSDISRSIMMRLAYRQLFATDDSNKQGYVVSAHFHHLFGTHPFYLKEGRLNSGFYPNYNELGVGFGYRWAYENFALIPQAYFRDQFAFGQTSSAQPVNQHLIGFEPGLRLEYWIYPEVLRLSVDYGFNVPFVHLTNQLGNNVAPFTLNLHRVYTELTYRLAPNFDLTSGFYWWQVPSQLGSGGITDVTLSNITGFQVGGGLTF